MTEKTDKSHNEKAPDRRAAQREARLKLALKANMARRKAQAKARGMDENLSGAGPEQSSGNMEE
ncbi:MAG: hypothetical protein JXR75_13010 [Rhodobacteraceae bacterium]|nr:hypothetical protein [Paracoccaceae bacterium]